MDYLIHLLIEACILLIASFLFSQIEVKGIGSAIIAALVIGLLNISLGAILDFIFGPLNFITFGLVSIFINALMLKLADWLLPGFKIKGFLYAVVLAILLAVGNMLFQ